MTMDASPAVPAAGDLSALGPLPSDEAGPVFREPWEARAFAMVLKLHEAGHFTWAEWAERLSAEIAAAQRAGDPDLGATYYRHWLAALETLVAEKRLLPRDELAGRAAALAAEHDH